jgi:hypothetical protein
MDPVESLISPEIKIYILKTAHKVINCNPGNPFSQGYLLLYTWCFAYFLVVFEQRLPAFFPRYQLSFIREPQLVAN